MAGVVAVQIVVWKPRVICDVCFHPVEERADMCPHCGTVFGDPRREYHEVDPERWVAAQVAAVRELTDDALRARRWPQTFAFDADDGAFRGEVHVEFDDNESVRITATLWAVHAAEPLASAKAQRPIGDEGAGRDVRAAGEP